MIDSLFSAALAFCILVGGTLAITSAVLEQGPSPAKAVAASKPATPATLVAATHAAEASKPTLR